MSIRNFLDSESLSRIANAFASDVGCRCVRVRECDLDVDKEFPRHRFAFTNANANAADHGPDPNSDHDHDHGVVTEDNPTAATSGNAGDEPTVFVLEFSGDTTASQVRVLRKAVTLILKVKCILRLYSNT